MLVLQGEPAQVLQSVVLPLSRSDQLEPSLLTTVVQVSERSVSLKGKCVPVSCMVGHCLSELSGTGGSVKCSDNNQNSFYKAVMPKC